MVNLAISDLLMFTTHCPLVLFNALLSDFWMWGPLGCKLYACSGAISGNEYVKRNLMYPKLLNIDIFRHLLNYDFGGHWL